MTRMQESGTSCRASTSLGTTSSTLVCLTQLMSQMPYLLAPTQSSFPTHARPVRHRSLGPSLPVWFIVDWSLLARCPLSCACRLYTILPGSTARCRCRLSVARPALAAHPIPVARQVLVACLVLVNRCPQSSLCSLPVNHHSRTLPAAAVKCPLWFLVFSTEILSMCTTCALICLLVMYFCFVL